MKKMNLIVVFDNNIENVLMCYRSKAPYKNKYNFVGGKIEDLSNCMNEAYRELTEETGIKKDDIDLIHFMNLTYVKWNSDLEIYYGFLKNECEIVEEVNKLHWISMKENFFDTNKFAGEGNIGHIIESILIDLNNNVGGM